MIELKEGLEQAIINLNQAEEKVHNFVSLLSEMNQREQDLLHYIENNTLSTSGAYSVMRELQKIRRKRREIKNLGEIWDTYLNNRQKLISNENRPFLLAEMSKREKSLGKKYTNNIYTKEELDKLARKVKE